MSSPAERLTTASCPLHVCKKMFSRFSLTLKDAGGGRGGAKSARCHFSQDHTVVTEKEDRGVN
jgi:hypothetical protein